MVSFADILKKKEQRDTQTDRPQVDWFSLKNNNPARIQFLQELDPEAPNFDSARGSALYLVEHVSPQNPKRRGVCTLETKGRCVGCELNDQFPGKNWWQKTNMYVWVFDAKDEKPKVLSRPAPGAVFDWLVNWANDPDDGNGGNITGVTFKISKGPNKQDPWLFSTTKNEIEVPSGLELVDLSKAVGIHVEVENQRNFYLPDGDFDPSDGDKEKPKESTPKSDALDW